MKIDNSHVQSAAERQFVQSYTSSFTRSTTITTPDDMPLSQEDQVTVSDMAKQMMEEAENQIREQTGAASNQKEAVDADHARISRKLGIGQPLTIPSGDDMKLSLLEKMFEMLTGRRGRFQKVDRGQNGDFSGQLRSQSIVAGNMTGMPRMQTTAMKFESAYMESESVSYSAKGLVTTEDGRSIEIDINMNMSREFAAYTSMEAYAQTPMVDPLMINYGGAAASLTQTKFQFDLDVDGKLDEISFAGAGSGFLALDKDADGVIDDGSELFGPQSGNGFNDLRAYDGDGNGWIDENDAIFEKLQVWTKDEKGNDVLYKLKELDIGAIYLGEKETQFSINDENNTTLGQMRSTSFFLKESGGAGTVSHIDLAL